MPIRKITLEPTFPPVSRSDFDYYYESLATLGVPQEAATHELIKDILYRASVPEGEARLAAAAIMQGSSKELTRQEMAPFRSAFRYLLSPKGSKGQNLGELTGLMLGLERLEKVTAIDPNLTPQEQKLVLVMVMAHEMNRAEKSYNRSWQTNVRRDNNTDREMN